MANIQIKSNKTDRALEFEKNFGGNLAEAVELYGEDTVYEVYFAQAVIKIQNAMRSMLDKADNTAEAVLEAANNYVLGVQRRSTTSKLSDVEKLVKKVTTGQLSIEQLKELVAALQAAGVTPQQ